MSSLLHDRVAKLERRVFGYQFALTGVVFAAGAAALMGGAIDSSGPADVRFLRTSRLEIVNADGAPVFVVEADSSGGRWTLYDLQGQPVVRAAAGELGGSLSVGSRDRTSLASMDCTKTGGQITVSTEDARPAARLAGHDFGGGLDIMNNLKQTVFNAAAGGPNGGRMTLFNQTGQGIFAAIANQKQGQIFLGDNEGTPIWHAP
jgi:hypothetical protein